ncbi:MAG: substrate-binding domain-containing protein [bacterium]
MKKKQKNNSKSIASIAEECGVSIMTVSRALRENSAVKKSTRDRIIQTAEKIGYHRSVKSGRPRDIKQAVRPTVDVVLGTFGRIQPLFYSRLLLTSIEEELVKHGHDCLIRTYNGEYTRFLSLRERLRQSLAIGTLIVGYFPLEQLKAILEIVPQAILVDNTGDPGLDCPYESVGFDNVEAARLAIRHLLSTGHKRIVLIKGFSNHYFSREIEQGYRETLKQHGIEIDENLILETDFATQVAYERISSIIDKGIKFDAVFTNDEMACGVIRALHERKINIPSDIAVAGCDGLPVGMHIMPRLTTVILDYHKLGRTAVEHLLDNRGKMSSPCRIKLVPVLEVRESTVHTICQKLIQDIKKSGKSTFVKDRVATVIKSNNISNLTIGVNIRFDEYAVSNWYYNLLMGSIVKACLNLGHKLQLISNLSNVTRNEIDGIIWVGPAKEECEILFNLSIADIPIIIVNRTPDNKNISYVTTDHREAVFKAIEYLLKLNHKKIGFISSPLSEPLNQERLGGYIDAFAKNSVKIDNSLIFEVKPYIKKQIYQEISEVVSKNKLSALFLEGASFIASTLKVIYDKGLKVPDDISVICFDDIEGLEEHSGPSLTSIRQPLTEMGKRTVQGLMRLVENRHIKIAEVIPSEFVLRQSCKRR